ncbi:22489_t:CDS:1, partial [Gigaspora rosea]
HTEFKCILKEGIELSEMYLNEEKVVQAEKYKLGEMIPEQQD